MADDGAEQQQQQLGCVRTHNLSDPAVAAGWIYTDTEKFLLHVVIPVVSGIGIAGNLAFLFMILRLPQMRNGLSSYLAVLATCDILFLMISNILYAITLAKSDLSLAWPASTAVGCATSVVSAHVWYFASVGIITLISVERYFAICQPIKHIHFQGKSRNAKLILAVLLFSFGVTISTTPRYNWYHMICFIWPDMAEYENQQTAIGVCGTYGYYFNTYEGLLLASVFAISVIINCFLYAKILLALSNRGILTDRAKSNPEANRVRNQVARTLIINGTVFFICQIPYRADNLDDALEYLGVGIDLISKPNEAIVTTIGQAFLFLNSVVNPFIYVLSLRHYRQGMVEAFTRKRYAAGNVNRKDVSSTTTSTRM